MSLISVNNLMFTYAGSQRPTISNVSLELLPGEITLIAGKSGSGKSTLLSLLKPEIRGVGQMSGEIILDGKPMPETTTKETVATIGYMCQNPEAQIVTDKVYRELTYGLENLGLPQQEIMARCAEISAFLGISHLFHKNTWELSGGQKQVLNLASLLVLEPKVLLLDEPTSRLDPVSAEEFLYLLQRVKNEFGLSVVLVEHDLDKVVHLCDKMCLMDNGQIVLQGTTGEVLEQMSLQESGTTAWKIWKGSGAQGKCPISLSESREYVRKTLPKEVKSVVYDKIELNTTVLKAKDLWYKHNRDQEYILRGVNFELHRGEFMCLMGANGSGKSTFLKAISKAEKGVTVVKDQRVAKLPQDVTELFLHDTVKQDLEYVLELLGVKEADRENKVSEIAEQMDIAHLLNRNPLKLSGGEQKRVALAKVMLSSPSILLLDEPTSSLDSKGRQDLVKVLKAMRNRGVAILAVTHDTELVAECDRVSVLFDGTLSDPQEPHKFLCDNRFFTTRTVSICRGWIDGAITTDEVLGVKA